MTTQYKITLSLVVLFSLAAYVHGWVAALTTGPISKWCDAVVMPACILAGCATIALFAAHMETVMKKDSQ